MILLTECIHEPQSGGERPPVVLVVDDHEDTRQMSLIVLRSQGFMRRWPRSAARPAFDRACEQKPDVIVTDLAMPDGDGWEFVQRLASDPRTKDIPVVMVTACATEAVRSRAAARRLAAFFFKPCAPDVLAAELRRLVAAAALRRTSPRLQFGLFRLDSST